MMYILVFITVVLISAGTYAVLSKSLRLPSNKAVQAIKDIHGRISLKVKMNNMMKPIARLLTKIAPLSEYKNKKLQNDFERLEIAEPPQEYVSTAKAKMFVLILFSCIFIPLGLPLVSLLLGVIASLIYLKSMNDIKKKLDKINHELQAELPRFIGTINYSLDGSRDFVSFIERYTSVAGYRFGTELDRLLIDMKIGDEQEALMKMDARIGLPSFSKLIAILCNVNKGIDKQQSLILLEQDVRAKEREYMKEQFSKQPKRIKASSVILTLLLILLFMIPLGLMIVQNLTMAGF